MIKNIMEQINKDVYFVALKVFLVNDSGQFLITKDRFGDWDIPGGRLRENDFEASFESIIERKMKEELGSDLRYELGEPIVYMRHERDEILASGERAKRRIFAIGYQAKYLGGNLALGKNHEKHEWVPIDSFIPENYFKGGWLKGVKEFQEKYNKLK